MQTEKERPFKVLIAGGSIAGLTLANALARANIDFLVLESHGQVDPSVGAALTVPTNACRILDQMGIYSDIQAHIQPTVDIYTYVEDGRLLAIMDMPRVIWERHSYPIAWLTREQLLRILYDNVPNKSKVLLNKKITRVDHSDDGVVAHCEDGSEYNGSMIAGADGIHSTIRGEMWKHMEESRKWKKIVKKDRKAMAAEYACIFGISRPMEGLKPGIIYRTWGKNFTTFANVGEGNQVFWVLFTKMDRKFRYPGVPKFTRKEQDGLAEKFMDTHVGAGIKFGPVYENATTSSFVPLEEGTCKSWTWGRFACLGDSVHKTTPNIGQGASLAIDDAASLANHIVSIVNKSGGMPSSGDIAMALTKWEAGLRPRARAVCDAGATYMRLEALANWPLKIAALYIAPHVGGVFADLLSVVDIGAPTLHFLALPERKGDSVSTEKGDSGRKWKVSWYIRAFWAANLRVK